MLHDSEEPPELRGRIAQLLAQIGGPTAHNLLAEIALRSNDNVGTRIACIESLAIRREPETASLLAQLVEATDEHATIREQASLALVQLIAHDGGAA
jgi:HEAT repeat protein